VAQIEGDTDESALTGRRLGIYQVQERIGMGGMGEVYRARDTRLDRDVAVKILRPRSPSDSILHSSQIARFRREARLLATLNHPHIGAIYGFETDGDRHALILELVEGDTLADRLRSGPIPLKDTLLIAGQIAEALDAAHTKGVVHRDLKPANIKITPSPSSRYSTLASPKPSPATPATPTPPSRSTNVKPSTSTPPRSA
jgi:serine/threonine protein kinase